MNRSWFFVAILSILVNLFFAFAFLSLWNQQENRGEKTPDSTLFPFLSKRIFIENQNDILINFIPLRSAMREYVGKQNGEVGVYFEYLPSGTSIGVNDNLEVTLASLIKTPLVMAVYKELEKGKIKKSDMITIEKDDLDEKFGNLWKKGEGIKLSVEDAVNFALIYSDNTAANMLSRIIHPTAIDDVFDSLDIATNKQGEETVITPKSYSSIFRSLYLSSYLSQKSSSEILDILTKTLFNDKIVAGVPKSVRVAHKIGVFDSATKRQKAYNDCGIVYVPERPYLLCIMAKTNEEKARKHMQHLSTMIYGYITAVKGGD